MYRGFFLSEEQVKAHVRSSQKQKQEKHTSEIFEDCCFYKIQMNSIAMDFLACCLQAFSVGLNNFPLNISCHIGACLR